MADSTTRFQHTVTEAEHGQRIDAVLAMLLDAYSRVFLRKVVQERNATVDNETVKPSYKVQAGQLIVVDLPPPPVDGPQPEDIPLDVIFEDEHFVAIDKPAGMVVHPAKGNWQGTLASALAFRFKDLSDVGGPTRPGIVHRLDRDTSGIILVAKSNAVHLALSEQFENRTVSKTYLAITVGAPQLDRDIIDQPIGPHPYQRDKMAIRSGHPSSREATTRYDVLERFPGYSLLEVSPKTGRTHQIRVHLDHVGCPVLCDRLYAGHSRISQGELLRKRVLNHPANPGDELIVLERQALHAHRLKFAHPKTREAIELVSPLRPDMQIGSRYLKPWIVVKNVFVGETLL